MRSITLHKISRRSSKFQEISRSCRHRVFSDIFLQVRKQVNKYKMLLIVSTDWPAVQVPAGQRSTALEYLTVNYEAASESA